MALGTSTQGEQQGQTTMRPNGILRMSFAGDDAYPAGGTLLFQEVYLLAELNRQVECTMVTGYGFTGGAITHLVAYDKATDALRCYTIAGAEATGDLSGVIFDVAVYYR